MDLINEFRQSARFNVFERCDYHWLNISKEKSKIQHYLEESQNGESTEYRFYIHEIENILNQLENEKLDSKLINKLVIQKSNFNVKNITRNKLGCTTRLIFLLKDSLISNDWHMYCAAKGTYTDFTKFNIKENESLGYFLYVSIYQKDLDNSRGIADSKF